MRLFFLLNPSPSPSPSPSSANLQSFPLSTTLYFSSPLLCLLPPLPNKKGQFFLFLPASFFFLFLFFLFCSFFSHTPPPPRLNLDLDRERNEQGSGGARCPPHQPSDLIGTDGRIPQHLLHTYSYIGRVQLFWKKKLTYMYTHLKY